MLNFDMIAKAARRLEGVTLVTPLLESELLNKRMGFRLLVKAECLQRTGSFKIRGAYVKIASLTEAERAAGVVAFSSGNHAQGVAAAASELGIASTIVMPNDAPAVKLRNTAEYGAKVITYDRVTVDRAKIARDVADETGAVLVPPYDDYVLMSGQGTIGLEIANQLAHRNATANALVCPAGGGGLIAGIATAMRELAPQTLVHSAEPENFDDTKRSLIAGERIGNEPGYNSICDSIVTQIPGEKTFPVNKKLLAEGFSVSETDVIVAMQALANDLRIVTEPGGAAAVAAILRDRERWKGKTVVAVVSGGNVDLDTFRELMKYRA
ncbi:threonine/serine dehydratase [Mesorhizobium sp. M1A.F.Ca.IN.022.05.2.1]|uniref:threonine ammonia-lyase n=3 Tax=Mesorhizobium TaxID=68287 RepID=UPI000FCC58AF|nr:MULTISPECIES: threonine/serine dehydratase [unclassified Mesorhizobium]RUV83704.1 threonine/serine dehydratase [Mesorhizobium sp. M1A.F.Ca.IN.020.32.1.1]RUW05313.1 threonine/serine dehydratase [Mesorhizobium sp. M1A.F.Ca.IN.022.05.2.1]RWF84995.1 MAG: threonine/serine dehydratase [Mesorhizobium sp.]RWG07048.1 MAG: threonine/serine dehydratase [Mesorhizobium sp.]RWG92650.1 MAG: threonine/serine dehydratase [Mesorhizobium sp.]